METTVSAASNVQQQCSKEKHEQCCRNAVAMIDEGRIDAIPIASGSCKSINRARPERAVGGWYAGGDDGGNARAMSMASELISCN